ncbi:MAG TPA: superoxide dismutase [Thermoanaerobaculia bacterium]|nr:superoxide dismutase [Thermoanaerobaculia bacterium]
MSSYQLPDLDYDYAALEPNISGKIMELHHDKHHAAYVKGANETLEKLDEARDKEDFTRLPGLEKALAFHLSGHVLHSLFWKNLAPKNAGRPEGGLADAIAHDFGSYEKFRRQMTQTAATIMGSGWAALVWEPVGKRLLTTQIYDHQSNLSQGGLPIMVIDAWEHAFYLQYQNRKQEFFEAIWNVWNWRDIAERFESVRETTLDLAGAAR